MAKFEITVDNETVEAVKQLVEERNERIAKRNEKREAGDKLERTSISEMCGELVTTGAFRRLAANKWADENRAPPKPRKAKAPKAKKAAAPKAKKPAAPKAKKPTIRKAKTVEPATPAPAATGTDGGANGSPLD